MPFKKVGAHARGPQEMPWIKATPASMHRSPRLALDDMDMRKDLGAAVLAFRGAGLGLEDWGLWFRGTRKQLKPRV